MWLNYLDADRDLGFDCVAEIWAWIRPEFIDLLFLETAGSADLSADLSADQKIKFK